MKEHELIKNEQGVLVSLTGYIFYADFHSKNKFPDMLPAGSLFFTHPLTYFRQYASVYRLHVEAVSAETAEKRRKQIDDARKRREYLRAHGVEKEGLFGFGTVEGDEAKRKLKEEKRVLDELVRRERIANGIDDRVADEEKGFYTDFEGNKKPVKKWLGIF
jgi:hypothetical protein